MFVPRTFLKLNGLTVPVKFTVNLHKYFIRKIFVLLLISRKLYTSVELIKKKTNLKMIKAKIHLLTARHVQRLMEKKLLLGTYFSYNLH